MYQVISDEKELKWFFDNVIQKPTVTESYSMVFVSRHKKLTKEEQETFGLTRKEGEFLSVQTCRLGKFKNYYQIDPKSNWTFDSFLKHVKRFNVDDGAYTTGLGLPIPAKTLAIIFYVNPCDDIKVADTIATKIDEVKTSLCRAQLEGKSVADTLHIYQTFGNLENNIKHLRAVCKGTKYWLDFDVDLPEWFKESKDCYEAILTAFDKFVGRGHYVVIQTTGGYHILCRTNHIHSNPHDVCKDVEKIYLDKTKEYNQEEYDKFECIVNDSQIPGLPLPGTYQYGNPVVVLNKEDYIK